MDEQQFHQVFSSMRGEVERYAARRVDPSTTEDVVSETFAALWVARERCPETVDGTRAWVYGIARRQLALAQRRRQRELGLGLRARAALAVGVPVVVEDPATGVVDADEARQVLAGLTPQDQEVLQLIGWDGLSPEEAAAVVGCSVTALTTRLSRARRRLEVAERGRRDRSDRDRSDRDRSDRGRPGGSVGDGAGGGRGSSEESPVRD